MGFPNKPQETNAPAALTAETAQAIFDYMVANLDKEDVTKMFLETGHNIKDIKAVIKEVRRIEEEAKAFCQNNKTVTKAELLAEVTSDILDVVKVGKAILDYNPTYEE